MKRLMLPILLAAALPGADSRVAPALNAFTTTTYKQVVQGDANLVLSPFNIATALSLARVGARGQTAEEIQTVLHLNGDPAYDTALATLLADLHKTSNTGGNELNTATGLWVQKGFAIRSAYSILSDPGPPNVGTSPGVWKTWPNLPHRLLFGLTQKT